MPEQLYNY